MTINQIDAGVITDAILGFLRGVDEDGNTVTPVADLSVDSSTVVSVILIGDSEAPDTEVGHPTQTAVDAVTGISDPYLVLRQVPLGAGVDREARSGYAGGTPSTRLLRYHIHGLGPSRRSAQRIATAAVARLTDDPPVTFANLGRHQISRRERYGDGAADRIADLHQWTEVADFDVSFAP